ncbi:hypothetical protein [Tepidanaerobacter syntrophicus]|uniref:Uncharacterized protein n=1 Tax=Tepidanaerobacter syntrophicus TaxID=224999 RepID=A0A0U9HFQ5_9FIRM|nr:hypothetical protein [Tepidanaerobacter syntrophicus]GAQ25350.1 hypothetical protein TSYNT_7371 [Tepidanaerobacter syntrophicus]
MRSNFVNGKNVQGGLIKWWDIKIKNALDNMQLIDEKFPFEAFDKAVAVIKFTFTADILRDIDNFAIKYIIDSLEKNKVIIDDNKDVLESMMPILATGGEQGIEVFVTDDNSLLKTIHFFYGKYKSKFEHLEEMKKNPLSPEEFFDLR